VLVVIDRARALRKAIRDVLGVHTPVQRCVRHKERNVLGHLPERDRPLVRRRLRGAWALDDHDRALEQLRALADELARSHPGAAASLREGMEETLTVTRLGVRGRLKRTLASTNPCEPMIETVRRVARNVKRWHNVDMCLRWTAAGMLEAEQQFRKIIGYTELSKLAVAVERDVAAKRAADTPTTTPQTTIATTAPEVAAPSPEKIHSHNRRHQLPRRAGCAQTVGGRCRVDRDPTTSSSSPAGGSPVRVAARRPGSRLPASGGNAWRRSAASRAPFGGGD
jgi:Transposase, Mutator family